MNKEVEHRLALYREIGELRAQIEAMTADWKLGQLVRRMPEIGWQVSLVSLEGMWDMWMPNLGNTRSYDEPEGALCEALGEEQE